LDDLALEATPGAGGMVLLPYLSGERTPNRPNASGALAGITGDVTRASMARAAYEGVVCGLLDGLDALHAATGAGNGHDGRTFLVGGGARSPAYRRIVADLSGRPITVAADDEHVALGACVQAVAVLHECAPMDVTDAWKLGEGTVVEPDPRVDRVGLRARYGRLRDGTS
ncbi:MAG TPA: FGGY-family carbohydrate kinase, partial [Acidimicrobiales bacterium]|nr:FGGY-family carbohydrate kinase [Acidimicrobiales bacterium]